MKNTPLTEKHLQAGAKMVDFAGFNMPVSYKGIKEEHEAVRKGVGVFDVSHMGEFIVRGRQALDLIQKVTTNDASRLEAGQAQYTCLPNGKGGIVDDLLVYRLPENMEKASEPAYMLVVNASNIEKDWNWIKSQNDFDANLINISDETALLAVQGPLAVKALKGLTEVDLDALKFYTFTKGSMAGIDNVLISATGYTGSGGFELYVSAEAAPELWNAVFKTGEPYGISPVGLGARDTLRLEKGFCLYGNDIDDTTSPLEAGLGWITKFKKGDFIDRDFLLRQKEEGVQRKLIGFTTGGRRIPRQGYSIEDVSGKPVGRVTSGTMSPSLAYPIGLGYVEAALATPGTKFMIDAGRKKIPAIITQPPFVK